MSGQINGEQIAAIAGAPGGGKISSAGFGGGVGGPVPPTPPQTPIPVPPPAPSGPDPATLDPNRLPLDTRNARFQLLAQGLAGAPLGGGEGTGPESNPGRRPPPSPHPSTSRGNVPITLPGGAIAPPGTRHNPLHIPQLSPRNLEISVDALRNNEDLSPQMRQLGESLLTAGARSGPLTDEDREAATRGDPDSRFVMNPFWEPGTRLPRFIKRHEFEQNPNIGQLTAEDMRRLMDEGIGFPFIGATP
jgi:hypothetical protein